MKCIRSTCTRSASTSDRCHPHYLAAKAAGEIGVVDSAAVVHHVHQLLNRGWTRKGLARHSGASFATVRRLADDPQPTVWVRTAKAILSVPLVEPDYDKHIVPTIGVVRRINSLRYMGWTVERIAERSGLGVTAIHSLLSDDKTTCFLSTHNRIARTYDELCMTQGPSKHAATRARKRGCVSPLCWDDIDDPSARPEGFSRYRHSRYLGRAA